MVTVGSLAGHALAGDKALATLPATANVVGTALAAIPASYLCRRLGRRQGFLVGAALAMAGGALGAAAVTARSFPLLVLGAGLVGMSAAFGQLYRFTAAEASPPAWRGRAISLVLAGGIAAGFAGPQLARVTVEALSVPFLGAYLCVPVLAALAIPFIARLDLPRPLEAPVDEPARPVGAIVRQRTFLVAALSQMAAYGVMNLEMTGTPLAMQAHHHGLADTAFVIQWHVLGMFVPGFLTGRLVERLGERPVILAGIALNLASLAVARAGAGVGDFWLALLLVGVGWNCMFVAGSAMVTRTYTTAERARAQGANEFLVFGTVALTSVASGQLLHRHGWHAVLAAALPLLLVALVAGLWPAGGRPAGSPPTSPRPTIPGSVDTAPRVAGCLRARGLLSGEEVRDGEADVGERERRHRLAGPVPRHAGIAVGARLPVDLDRAVHRQAEPELCDAGPGIEARLDEPVEADGRVGHLDRQQDVLGGGKLPAVGDGPWPQQDQIRLRLRAGPDDHGVLRRDDGAVAEPGEEQPVGVDHTAGVSRTDRRHLDDLTLDQLDALVRTEDAGLRHAVVLLHTEQPARNLDFHDHRLPPGPV
jgi:MFS family permease